MSSIPLFLLMEDIFTDEGDTEEFAFNVLAEDNYDDTVTESSESESETYEEGVEDVPMDEESSDYSQPPIDLPPINVEVPGPSVSAGPSLPIGENVHSSTPNKPTSKATASVAAAKNDSSLDDDGQTCSICFDQWTNSSEHRLVSLRCGHLFGRSCITRWLKGQNSRCPQCNARARKSEIRNIYAKAVKVVDSSERDKALRDLQHEVELRRKAEIAAATDRVKIAQMLQENERLRKELMEANGLLQEYRKGLYSKLEKSQAAAADVPYFLLSKCIDIHKNGGCRIIDTCNLLDWAIVSQASNTDLFPGYGFRKISFSEMKPEEFTIIHQKPIKDMAFHNSNGLVLTASLDKTVKITNTLTNSVVHSYSNDSDVWSCTWDTDDSKYFYAGLKTGDVYLYDIRVTSRYVMELPKFGSRTPAASIQYVKSSPGSKGGLLVGKLSDCALYQKQNEATDYKVLYPPTVGPYSSMAVEPVSGHILISSRPSPKQPRVTHTVCEVVPDSRGGVLCCNPVQSVLGGRTQVQLTRSKLLRHPDDFASLLVCAGDEDAQGALIWDGSSGNSLAQLKTDPSPVVDLAQATINNKYFLLALTDKTLRVYQWNR